MASSRDDFVIAIRSAFLKKGNRQKFSLFTLLIASCFVLSLEYFKSGPVEQFRSITRDIIYRGSYIISIPFKFIHNTYENLQDHMNMYEDYKKLKNKNFSLNSVRNELKFYKSENKLLKNLVNEENLPEGSYLLTRVIIDRKSPFLKSIIINKGFESGIKKGMAVLDRSYMVGRVVETNYLSSRVLLLNDLNSKISVIIEPSNAKAIMTGSGENYADLDYLPEKNLVKTGDVVYTSGSDGIFKAGIPIGMIKIKESEKESGEEKAKKIVNFFSNFKQINFVKIRNLKR